MLWAVHISDGILRPPWIIGGYAVAAVLLAVSLWRIRDEEVPRIALLTAAFFIVCLMHVRIGYTSVHLLFNGLVGVLLGWRAPLAIACGLFLQFQYLAHGGITTLGVNTCILTLPALAAWFLFHALRRVTLVRLAWGRSALVALTALIWVLSLVFSVTLLHRNSLNGAADLVLDGPWQRTTQPLSLVAAGLIALSAALLERRLKNAPEFALGLLIGEFTVLASVALNCIVLLLGGEQPMAIALILLVIHLPIAVLEGVILGFTVGFLARVKPEMLGIRFTNPRLSTSGTPPAT